MARRADVWVSSNDPVALSRGGFIGQVVGIKLIVKDDGLMIAKE